jgi:hypothetical protein
VHVDVLADGGLQLFHASEHATSNSLIGDRGEPAFHQVDPGAVGGGKVNMKSWTLGEPFADDRGFVGAVVIDDKVRFQCGGARSTMVLATTMPSMDRAAMPCAVVRRRRPFWTKLRSKTPTIALNTVSKRGSPANQILS